MRIRSKYQLLQKEHEQALVAQNMDNWIIELEQVMQVTDDLLSNSAIQENVDTVSKLQKIKSFLESL